MPETKQSSNSNMTIFWVLVILMILGGLFLYKTTIWNSAMKYSQDQVTQEAPIQDTKDLDEATMELDEADLDAAIDAELDALEIDANSMQ
jgi:hypothetical protein